jgi:hypothetical protein
MQFAIELKSGWCQSRIFVERRRGEMKRRGDTEKKELTTTDTKKGD